MGKRTLRNILITLTILAAATVICFFLLFASPGFLRHLHDRKEKQQPTWKVKKELRQKRQHPQKNPLYSIIQQKHCHQTPCQKPKPDKTDRNHWNA